MTDQPSPGTSVPAESTSHSPSIAATRAGAAVLWAFAYLSALHGQRVLSESDIPLPVGLLLAAYPVIDAIASWTEWHRGSPSTDLRVAVALDAVAIAALLVATLGLDTRAVLIAFGAWALVSGLLQLAHAVRSDQPRRSQLPLILSGAISAVAGTAFAATASHHVAGLAGLGGYALLGAVFFLFRTYLDRRSVRLPG